MAPWKAQPANPAGEPVPKPERRVVARDWCARAAARIINSAWRPEIRLPATNGLLYGCAVCSIELKKHPSTIKIPNFAITFHHHQFRRFVDPIIFRIGFHSTLRRRLLLLFHRGHLAPRNHPHQIDSATEATITLISFVRFNWKTKRRDRYVIVGNAEAIVYYLQIELQNIIVTYRNWVRKPGVESINRCNFGTMLVLV